MFRNTPIADTRRTVIVESAVMSGTPGGRAYETGWTSSRNAYVDFFFVAALRVAVRFTRSVVTDDSPDFFYADFRADRRKRLADCDRDL